MQKIDSLTELVPRFRRRYDRAFMHQRPQPSFPPPSFQPFGGYHVRRNEFLAYPGLFRETRRSDKRRRSDTIDPPVDILRFVEETIGAGDAGDDDIEYAWIGLRDCLNGMGARMGQEQEWDGGMVERLDRGKGQERRDERQEEGRVDRVRGRRRDAVEEVHGRDDEVVKRVGRRVHVHLDSNHLGKLGTRCQTFERTDATRFFRLRPSHPSQP